MREPPFVGDWISDQRSPSEEIYCLPLDTAYYAEIGRITAHVSGAEHRLHAVLWRILGVSADDGKVLTRATRTETQIDTLDLLIASGRPHDDAVRTKLKAILDDIKEIRKQRNDVVHSLWVAHLTENGIQSRSLRYAKSKNKNDILTDYSIVQLRKLSNNAHKAYSQITDLINSNTAME